MKGLLVRWGLIEKAAPKEEYIPMSSAEKKPAKEPEKKEAEAVEIKTLLRPKVLVGQCGEYEIGSNALLITDKERCMLISWDKLDTFIQELQEIKMLKAQ